MKRLADNIELIAHVELNPDHFRKSDPYSVPRRERPNYWNESLAEAGLQGLHTIEAGWWQVALRDIFDDAILQRLFEHPYKPIPKTVSNPKDLFFSFDGGLSLIHQGEVIIAANCCSDLGNIDGWKEASKQQSIEWLMLWNGHPWVYTRYENGDLLFSDYTEKEMRVSGTAKYAIPAPLIQAAVKQASRDIYAFSERAYAFWGKWSHAR